MQPALRLATKILESSPPFWKSITNIYCLRPIPLSIDSRTYDQQDATGNIPLTSIWLGDPEVDVAEAERHMYPAASLLHQLGFDARELILRTMTSLISFSFMARDESKIDTGNKAKCTPEYDFGALSSCEIQISLSPEVVWPLLVAGYSEAEKCAVSVQIAAILIHELAHAVKQTTEMVLLHALDVQDAEGRPYPQPILTTLRQLATQMGVSRNRSGNNFSPMSRVHVGQPWFVDGKYCFTTFHYAFQI